MRASVKSMVPARGQMHQLRRWPGNPARPLHLLHGIRDSSATFQFLVDALPDDLDIHAPDARGHGGSPPTDALWLHDMVADAIGVMEALHGGRPVPLIAHSMGANVASIVASLRPDLVSDLVLLDALGPFPRYTDVTAEELFTDFIDRLRHRERRELTRYASVEEMAKALTRHNPRLLPERALWLAGEQARPLPDGGFEWCHDPRIGRTLAGLRDLAEWQDLWRRIECPVFWVTSGAEDPRNTANIPAEIAERMSALRDIRQIRVEGSSHNLHHEKPDVVADLILRFLAGHLPALAPVEGAKRVAGGGVA